MSAAKGSWYSQPDHALLGDEDAARERLADRLPFDWFGLQVGTVAVLGPGGRLADSGFDTISVAGLCSQGLLSDADLLADPVLFSLEQIKGYGCGVVRLE